MSQNGIYQLLSPIFLFLVLISLLARELYIIIVIIIILIIVLSITTNCFFDNHDNFVLEIGRFIGYLVLVVFFIVTLFALITYLESDNIVVLYSIIVLPIVLSMHIRLIKYDVKTSKFSYNKLIIRNRYYVTSKTIVYPKFSAFALFRIEFYLILFLSISAIDAIGRFKGGIPEELYMDALNIIFIGILLDIFIYLIISKYTSLLKNTA